jgi:hypothetical protein
MAYGAKTPQKANLRQNPLSHDARRAALLQRMHAMREQGLSYLKIANQLNTEGEPTLNHRGSWKAGTVYNLLQESA